MTLYESMKSAYALRKEKETLEAEIKKIQSRITEIDAQLSVQNNDILNEMKERDTFEVCIEGLFATLFTKSNVGYTSEGAVIDWLKANGYSKFVKTKVTESLDKTPLKKELKTNTELAKALESMTVTTETKYVVVTDTENHAKMLEHIAENKKD